MELTARHTECFFWPQTNRFDREQRIIKVSYFWGHNIINCSKLMGVRKENEQIIESFQLRYYTWCYVKQ